jgi:hypothetical protein
MHTFRSHRFIKKSMSLIMVLAMLALFSDPLTGPAQATATTAHRTASSPTPAVPSTPDQGPSTLERLMTQLQATQPTAVTSGSLEHHLRKLDSNLQALIADDLDHHDVVATSRHRDLEVSNDKRVLVEVYVHGAADVAADALTQQGMQVTGTNNPNGMVEGWLPLGAVIQAASLDVVRAVIPVTAIGVDTGGTLSQGDAAHQGPAARTLGANGRGVVVGVISDSMSRAGSGLAGSQASGDLPRDVRILREGPTGSSDEGRAMAEVIYDTAPGIPTFLFASGITGGAVGKAAAIDTLRAHGAQIIADDIFKLSEPFFQDGVVAQAVDAAAANGVAYFASAGNRARQSYESTFRPRTNNFHDFDPDTGSDAFQTVVTIPNGGFFQIVLQWDEAWGAAKTNLNAYLHNTTTGAVLVSATTDNLVTGLPIETISWTNQTGASMTVSLAIERAAGTATPFMKYIARASWTTITIKEYNTASDAINPDAASAKGSIAVAAINWNEAGLNDPTVYSSRGPKTRLFTANGARLPSPEVRQKPQVAGATGISTSVPAWRTFPGTSAATPSVAGVAALVKSKRPTLSVSALYSILINPANTIDCTLPGNPDTDCGYGFVLADRAVAAASDGRFQAPVVVHLPVAVR